MRKVTLILTVVLTLALFSCGGNSNSDSSNKKVIKTEQTKQTQETREEENTYVKDKFLKDMDLKTTDNKYSQKEWKQISKTCNAYNEFKETIKNNNATCEELETFFKNQGYKDYQEGKNDILKFKELYQIFLGIPVNIGSLGGIKKLYGEEQYLKSCKSTGEEYNELGLSADDLKNIEKNGEIISQAYLINMSINTAEVLSNK
jgi:hypothetical protein